MHRALSSLVVVMLASLTLSSQTRGPAGPVVYEGARLITGDGSAPIENGAFLVQNGRVSAIGPRADVKAPAGAARVDLTGKTVMPAMINAHVHIGYEGYTSWGAKNYTPQNVLDHLRREAYYGVAATQSVGSSPTDASIAFARMRSRLMRLTWVWRVSTGCSRDTPISTAFCTM